MKNILIIVGKNSDAELSNFPYAKGQYFIGKHIDTNHNVIVTIDLGERTDITYMQLNNLRGNANIKNFEVIIGY